VLRPPRAIPPPFATPNPPPRLPCVLHLEPRARHPPKPKPNQSMDTTKGGDGTRLTTPLFLHAKVAWIPPTIEESWRKGLRRAHAWSCEIQSSARACRTGQTDRRTMDDGRKTGARVSTRGRGREENGQRRFQAGGRGTDTDICELPAKDDRSTCRAPTRRTNESIMISV
jgi:hypothetical protein